MSALTLAAKTILMVVFTGHKVYLLLHLTQINTNSKDFFIFKLFPKSKLTFNKISD